MRTDPRDVARVESKTFICTKNKGDAIPTSKEGVQGKLGNWTSIDEMEKTLGERFPGCMKGRALHVHIPPVGHSKNILGEECHPNLKLKTWQTPFFRPEIPNF